MDKLEKILEEKLLPLAGKMQSNKILSSISNGLLAGMPFMIIGSLALVIQYPPVDYTTLEPGFVYTLMKGWNDLGTALGSILSMVGFACMDCFALVSSAAIGWHLGKKEDMQGLSPMVIALVSFLLCAAFNADMSKGFGYFGGSGLLAALIVSVVSVKALKFLIDHKFGRIEVSGGNVPPAITESFITLAPSALIVVCWAIINTLCLKLTGNGLPGVIALIMSPLVSIIASPVGTVLYTVICGIGWWMGIHDSAFSGPFSPFLYATLTANQQAYAAGTSIYELPHIINEGFFWTFVNIGGCASTFGLAVLLILFAKSKQCKTVGKLGIVPAFFNINEPLIFGLPMMMNPIFVIPMGICAGVNCIVASAATALKLVPHVIVYPGWNLWPPIGAAIATVSWQGPVLALVLIAIDMVIYYPFFKAYDNQKVREETAAE